MAKTIFKVIYIAFAAVLAVVVFSFNYQSNQYNAVIDRVNKYIKNEEYSNVARIFGGAFDSNNILETEKYDDVTMVLYPGTKENIITFTQEDALKADEMNDYVFHKKDKDDYTFHRFQKAYYLYLFDIKYSLADVKLDDNVFENAAAVRFIGENDEEYDYMLKITSTVNTDLYVKAADNLKDATLVKDISASGKQVDRNIIHTYNGFNVAPITFDELKISYIKEELGANIKAFNLVDRDGYTVFDEAITFNFQFDDQFFTDAVSVFDAYDAFVPFFENYNSDSFSVLDTEMKKITKEEYKSEKSKFNTNTEDFANEIKEGVYPSYKLAMTEKEIFGNNIIGKTIGIEVLYVLVVVIIYILIFKFATIKRLVFRQKEPEFIAKNKNNQTKND